MDFCCIEHRQRHVSLAKQHADFGAPQDDATGAMCRLIGNLVEIQRLLAATKTSIAGLPTNPKFPMHFASTSTICRSAAGALFADELQWAKGILATLQF